jgi:hypothetical protein
VIRIKINNRVIFLEENRSPLERAVKALRITQVVNARAIQRVADIYDLPVKEIKSML